MEARESEMMAVTSQITQKVADYVIQSAEQYEDAGELLKDIKKQQKEVADYWAPAKTASDKAHKAIVANEKAMLDPLKKAEHVLKDAMIAYRHKVEMERKRQEEEARRLQQMEADRLLEEAARHEASGDEAEAANVLAMAQMVNEMDTAVAVEKPEVAGMHVRKTWRAVVDDPSQVPVSFMGFDIRPIDMTVLHKLAKFSQGKATVPGVHFVEESSMYVRA